MNTLADKKFIVTGCTGGIGNAVCSRLKNEHAFIIGFNRNPAKRSEYANKQYSFDMSSITETEKNIKYVSEKYGVPDYLIFCSGSLIPGVFSNLSNHEILSVVNSNLISLFNIIKAVQPRMMQNNKGNIVIIGSLGGIVPMPYSALYSSMKFAVRGFCLSIYEELKTSGITISLLSPGPVDTEMLRKESEDDNAAISFIQSPMVPDYCAEKILSIIKNPVSEKIFPASGIIASLLFSVFPRIYVKVINLIGFVGKRGIKNYRNNLQSITG